MELDAQKRNRFNRWRILLLTAILTRLLPVCYTFKILYLQENQLTFTASPPKSTALSAVYPDFVSTTQFGMSAWVQKTTWSSIPTNDSFFQVSNNPANYFNNGRVLLASARSNLYPIFHFATTGNSTGDWYPWESSPASSVIPINTWIFLAAFIDNSVNTQYGFNYRTIEEGYSLNWYNNAWSPTTGNLYTINPTSKIYWGGDSANLICNCYIHYVRFYIDYVANMYDQMINLALMNPQSTLYLFRFVSNPALNSNQTVPVEYLTNTTQGVAEAVKGLSLSDPIWEPESGPYNVLYCRPGSYLSFETGELNANGIVVAMDIQLYSSYSGTETLFAIRNNIDNVLSLSVEYDSGSQEIQLLQQTSIGTWTTVVLSTTSITLDSWNRMIFEIVQVQPVEFGIGFCSAKIWLNGVGSSLSFFCSFSSGITLFFDNGDATIELCSQKESGQAAVRNSAKDSYADIVNFMWLKGADGIFSNSSDLSCALSGFLSLQETICLQCKSGYYLVDTQCLTECPANYFLHTGTNSCQKCAYNDVPAGNGYCNSCTNDGMTMIDSECIACDTSCRKCTGIGPTDCSACYADTYLLTENSTCSTCSSEGYYIANLSLCVRCDTSCRTCSGPSSTDCLSCQPGLSLVSSACQQTTVSPAISAASTPISTASTPISAASTASSIALNVQQVTTSILPTLGSTTALILINFVSDIFVYRFINVPFPNNFIQFIMMLDTNFLPNPYNTASQNANITTSQIGQFKNYQITVAMFTNCGDKLDREIIAIVLILLAINFTAIAGKYGFVRAHRICKKIRDNIMWNLLLTFYIADFTDIFMFSLVQFREGGSDGWYAQYNLTFSILFLVSYLILLGFIFYLLNLKGWKGPQDAEASHTRIPFWINMIGEGIKQNTRFNRNFILFIVSENILQVLLIVYFQDHGLAQAIIYMIIELIALILAGILSRPFTSRLQNFIFIMNSIYKIIFGVIAILFGCNQQQQLLTDTTFNSLGTMLIAFVISAIIANAVVGIVATLSILAKLYRARNKKNSVHPEEPNPISLGEMNSIPPFTLANCQPSMAPSGIQLQSSMSLGLKTSAIEKTPVIHETPRSRDDFELFELSSHRSSQKKLQINDDLEMKVKENFESPKPKRREPESLAELMEIQVLDHKSAEDPGSHRNLDTVERLLAVSKCEITIKPLSTNLDL